MNTGHWAIMGSEFGCDECSGMDLQRSMAAALQQMGADEIPAQGVNF